MMPFIAQSIGITALKSIQFNTSAVVYGITSKGVFLRMADASIVFMSRDTFRNPLSINVPGSGVFLETVQHSDLVEISNNVLFFRAVNDQLEINPAAIWSARKNETPLEQLPPSLKIKEFITHLQKRLDQSVEYFSTVLTLFGIENVNIPTDLRTALRCLISPDSTDLDSLSTAGKFFAGRGRGLTPSGDDLLLGWCYALDRLSRFHNFEMAAIHQIMVEQVSKRSTLISANLIAAASQGELDERLLHAFEALTGLIPLNAAVLDGVVNWGNSSGIEAVAGMLLALYSVYRLNKLPFIAMA